VASSERSRQVRGLPVLDDIDLQDLHARRDGKVDIRPHEKGDSTSHGARLVCQNNRDDKMESDQ
jgi:hypothetical protein